MTSVSDHLVLLRGGVTVPAAVYLLLLDLEAHGISVRRDGDALLVGPRDRLTPAHDAALRRHKPGVLALLDYCAQPDLDAHLFSDRPREVAHA